MKRLPWVKWFAAAFLGGIRDLEPNEITVYVVILNLIFDEGAPIRDDAALIAKRCNMRPTSCAKSIEALVAKGKITRRAGKLRNQRAEKELKSRQEVSEKSAKSAWERWNKPAENGAPDTENTNKNSAAGKRPHSGGNAKAHADAVPIESEVRVRGSEDKSSASGDLIDPDRDAWRMVLLLLADRHELSDAAARRFFGGLLKDHGLEARDMLGAIAEATGNATQDAKAFLTGAAAHRAKKRAGPQLTAAEKAMRSNIQ